MTFKELFKKVDEMNKMIRGARYDDEYNVALEFEGITRIQIFKSYKDFEKYIKAEYFDELADKILKQNVIIGHCHGVYSNIDYIKISERFRVDLIK